MGSIQPESDIVDGRFKRHDIETKSGRPLVGANANPACPNLLAACTRKDITPRMGTELGGVQLKDLTDVQIDELALFIAQRGCVYFRDQDWTDIEQADFAGKLGELEKADKRRDGCPEAMTYLRTDENSADAPGEEFHVDLYAYPQSSQVA